MLNETCVPFTLYTTVGLPPSSVAEGRHTILLRFLTVTDVSFAFTVRPVIVIVTIGAAFCGGGVAVTVIVTAGAAVAPPGPVQLRL